MSDDDLIRRGDAIAAVRASDFRWGAEEAIDDLPAVTVEAILAKVPTRYQTANGDRLLHESDILAAMEPVTQPAPDAAMRLETVSENIARDMREGRFPARSEPQMVPVEPAPDPVCTDCGGTGITYQTERRCACQPAPHVNETPKSEHDAGNVLTAGAIREDSPNHAYRVGYAAGRAAALREAAATVQAGDTVQSIQRRILALLTEKPHDRA